MFIHSLVRSCVGSIGCDLVFVPAAYPICIGPLYWELVHRARAVDNQFFVAAVSPARNDEANYVVYGHSMVIDPIGKILVQAGYRDEIIFTEIGKYSCCFCSFVFGRKKYFAETHEFSLFPFNFQI